jgi:hypothetical protein
MTFETLRELVLHVTPNKTKGIEVIGAPSKQGVRLNALYEGILYGKFENHDQAARSIYGTLANSQIYRNLCNRLFRRLVNTVFIIDLNEPGYSELGQARGQCQADLAAASILLERSKSASAIHLLQNTLEQSERFELTQINTDVTRLLRRAYSRSANDIKKYEEMTARNHLYEDKRRWEYEALECYEQIVRHYIKGQGSDHDLHLKTAIDYQNLCSVPAHHHTFFFTYYKYCIGLAHYMSGKQLQQAADLSHEALIMLEQKPHIAMRGQKLHFLTNRVLCLTHLRQFDVIQQESLIDRLNANLTSTDVSILIKGKRLEAQYYLFSGQYNNALRIVKEINDNPKLKSLKGIDIELWRLQRGYIYLLSRLGKLTEADIRSANLGEFKITTFENSFEILNQEKDGMNIPVLLLSFIFKILDKKYDELLNKIESIKKYQQRHLKSIYNKRSESFLKLLFELTRIDSKSELALRNIRKALNVLQNHTFDDSTNSNSIEIIPYEELALLLLAHLNIKKRL